MTDLQNIIQLIFAIKATDAKKIVGRYIGRLFSEPL